MILSEITTTLEIVPLAGLALGIAAIVYKYGSKMIKDKFAKHPNNVTPKQVHHYFMDRGYIVYDIMPIANTYNWEAEIIEEGKSISMILYTDGDTILEHQYKDFLSNSIRVL